MCLRVEVFECSRVEVRGLHLFALLSVHGTQTLEHPNT